MEYAPSHTSPVLSPATFNADFPCSKSTGAMLPLHLAESSSLAAASCLTISLGFLATHLAIKLSIMLKTKYRYFSPGEDCAVADLPLLVQQESGPYHPTRPLHLGRQNQNVQNILTRTLSLTPKALAMVRLLSLMMGKPAWPEADN